MEKKKSIRSNVKLCHITGYYGSPIFTCACDNTHTAARNLINFTDTRFLLLDYFLSLPSPSSLHLSSARPELGERKTEKKKKKKKKREIGFPFHIGSLEWSLKPQSALALDKEAGFNKYVD